MTKIDFQSLYKNLQPYCYAIYLGGSEVVGFISNSHDHDIILFVKAIDSTEFILKRNIISQRLYFWLKDHSITNIKFDLFGANNTKFGAYDFMQYRNALQEEHDYGSYINKLMIKLAGNDVDFTFDVIDKDRIEYLNILWKTILRLSRTDEKQLNQKRWYQVYIGVCIVKNKSYNLTEEQKENANILHDMKDETLEKRKELQQEIIKNFIKLYNIK